MSNTYDLAKRLKGLNKSQTAKAGWYRARCIKESPVTFSAADGNLQFEGGKNLIMTMTARGHLWKVGETAAGILDGNILLLIDRI